jgi:hypothetical protein
MTCSILAGDVARCYLIFVDWSFAKLFLSTKAHTGCRLMDRCALESSQLREGRLVFPPERTNGPKERKVPPEDLAAALQGHSWARRGCGKTTFLQFIHSLFRPFFRSMLPLASA